jgi:hypothetical protein
MKIIPTKFSKIDFIRQIITCLLAVILFLTMLSSVARSGPKGKAIGHDNMPGNSPIPAINGGINPAGIIVGSGGIKINGISAATKPGDTSGQNGVSGLNPANFAFVLNAQGNGVLGNVNRGKGIGGNMLTLAAGDSFSTAIPGIGSLSASLTLPDPIGAKGPNPAHGGSHPKKGGGNPGGGNGNGHWGQGNQGNGKGNTFMGNQGRGVGEGMAGIDPGTTEPPDPPEAPGGSDPPEPPEQPENPTTLFVEAAPLPKDMIFKMGQCPALMALAAKELGVSRDDMQIHLVNALADSEDINPCQSYAKIANCAAVLRDPGQVRTAALTKVISEIVSPAAPVSDELLASVSQALATHRNDEDKPYYRLAGQWLDALVEYVGILQSKVNWPADESVEFVLDKYVAPVTEGSDVSLAMFLHLQLEALSGS